jgi:cobalt-zinc-cadmium efflux system membrane fusion protein
MNTKLTLCCLLGGLLGLGCHRGVKTSAEQPVAKTEGANVLLPQDSPQLTSLNVEAAQACNSPVAHLNGRLIWDEDVTVRIFTPFTGRVTKILTDVGQEIRKGDVLALIASPDYGQAQSDYRSAVSAFFLAERNLSRIQDLFEHGAAPQKDLYSAQADYERARSERERTSARLALYGGNTNTVDQLYELKSELDGVVVEKNVNPGQEVRADAMLANSERFFSPLFVVTDPRRLWIQLDASEQDLANLKVGQSIVVHARAFPDLIFKGKIELISDYLDPATRTIKVRGLVENPERSLKAEMFVNADVPIQSSLASGVDVSAKAVFFKSDKRFVFVETTPGRYERHQVKVGPEHDGQIVILEGVAPGQRLVTQGCLLLDQMLASAGP